MQEKEFIASALAIARQAAIGNPGYRFTGAELALKVDEGVEHFSPEYQNLVDCLRVLEKQEALIETGKKTVRVGGTTCWVKEYVFRDVDHPKVLAYLGIQSPDIDRKERELDLLRRSTAATEIQAKEAQRQSELAEKQSKRNFLLSLTAIAIAVISLVVTIAK